MKWNDTQQTWMTNTPLTTSEQTLGSWHSTNCVQNQTQNKWENSQTPSQRFCCCQPWCISMNWNVVCLSQVHKVDKGIPGTRLFSKHTIHIDYISVLWFSCHPVMLHLKLCGATLSTNWDPMQLQTERSLFQCVSWDCLLSMFYQWNSDTPKWKTTCPFTWHANQNKRRHDASCKACIHLIGHWQDCKSVTLTGKGSLWQWSDDFVQSSFELLRTVSNNLNIVVQNLCFEWRSNNKLECWSRNICSL